MERELPRISARLELPAPRKVQVHLARGEQDLPSEVARTMPGWAAGIALPDRALLAVRLDRLALHPSGDLEVVLAHELVHLAMGVLGQEDFAKIPWWFHEGTAQELSGIPYFLEEADLRRLAAAGQLRFLDRLGGEERPDRRATDLAYQQAWSFAQFLSMRCGQDVFARILAHLPQSADFNLAFLQATGHSYVTLEEMWKALLLARPGATMLQFSQQFFLILLVLALPLVALALIRRFKKEDEIEARWQEQERPVEPSGPGEEASEQATESHDPAGDD